MKSEMINNDNKPRQIIVEVAYAIPRSQVIYTVEVNEGALLEEAILASGILEEFPEINLTINKFGIFSKLSKRDKILSHKDRIEIYRPLIADPKAVRKKRAEEGKKMKKGS